MEIVSVLTLVGEYDYFIVIYKCEFKVDAPH